MITRTRTAALAALALAAGALVGCGSGDAAQASAPATTAAATATPAPRTEDATPGVRLARVRGGLGDALYVTGAPGQPNRLFVVEQSGRIRILDHGRLLLAPPFLDVSRIISSAASAACSASPSTPTTPPTAASTSTTPTAPATPASCEYRRASDDRADPGSARVLLTIDAAVPEPQRRQLAFGPDGDLYVGMGDGGSGGDPHGNGQNVDTLLGKLLRIDVDARTGSLPYGIPAGNPFAAGRRAPPRSGPTACATRGASPSTAPPATSGSATSARTTSRRSTTGPRARRAGVNFGWNTFEGRRAFRRRRLRGVDAHARRWSSTRTRDGCSITGGYVYRGTRARGLIGRYVYADFCSGTVWSMRAGPKPGGVRQETGLGPSISNVTSFGEALNGDLFMIAGGTLYRFVGR